MDDPSENNPRGRQEAKTFATRAKLCHAALQVIGEMGYHNATTTIIAKAAGVSRGAQTHHYPTKIDLVVAAFEALVLSWKEKHDTYEATHNGKIDIDSYLNFVWAEVFNDPHYVASLEIVLAAQGDEELDRRLKSLSPELQSARHGPWNSVFADRLSPAQSEVLSQMTVCLFRGMALQPTVDDVGPETTSKMLDFWREIITAAAAKPDGSR